MWIKKLFTINNPTQPQRITIIAFIVPIVFSALFGFLFNLQNGDIAKRAQDELFATQAAFNEHMSETQIAFTEKMNNDQKEFQTHLIATQTELDKQNSITSLYIDHGYLTSNETSAGFNIYNIGKTTAKNIVIYITLINAKDEWKGFIKDIKDFRLDIPSFEKRTIITDKSKTDILSAEIDGDNRYVIEIGNLAPGKNVYIFLNKPGSQEDWEHVNSVSRKLYVYSRYTEIDPLRMTLFLRRPVDELYPLAKFSVVAYCDNCSDDINWIATVSSLGKFDPQVIAKTKVTSEGWYLTEYLAEIESLAPPDIPVHLGLSGIILREYGENYFERVWSTPH